MTTSEQGGEADTGRRGRLGQGRWAGEHHASGRLKRIQQDQRVGHEVASTKKGREVGGHQKMKGLLCFAEEAGLYVVGIGMGNH